MFRFLVEKPITDNIDDARKLADRSEDARVPVLVGHHRTYSPLLDAAVAFLNSARFGRLVAVQGSALFYKPVKYFKDGAWRTKVGGGPILINLIHEIGLLRYFCGRSRQCSPWLDGRFEILKSRILSPSPSNSGTEHWKFSPVRHGGQQQELGNDKWGESCVPTFS